MSSARKGVLYQKYTADVDAFLFRSGEHQMDITGGKAPLLKLRNNISTGLNINERILEGTLLRKKQSEADVEFRKETKETLDVQEVKSKKQVEFLVENLKKQDQNG